MSNNRFCETPKPPYYAVIFTNQKVHNADGYDSMAQNMFDLALKQPGCYGAESTRDAEGFGITVSYWKDQDSIEQWKNNVQHIAAKRLGMSRWYEHYVLRIAKVEYAYSGPSGRPAL